MTELRPVDTGLHRARLKVRDFLLLDQHGAFAAYRKTELLDGEIYFMNAQHRPHGRVKSLLYDALRDALRKMGSPYVPMMEVSVALSDDDMPEPDITLTSEPDGLGAIPVETVGLIIEVSDTTDEVDLGTKPRRYAKAGVPEYWVANLKDRKIHVMWSATAEGYGDIAEIAFGEVLAARTLSGLEIDTGDL